MRKIVANTFLPHKSSKRIVFMCLALFFIVATGSAQNLLTKTGDLTSDPLLAIDQYGAIGSGKGLGLFGGIIDAPLFTDITSSVTGRVWMGHNLGATQVASTSTDAASYGDLYQWGRGTDGHEMRSSPTSTTQSSSATAPDGKFIINSTNWISPANTNLWQGIGGINNPCPAGYYVPTKAEFEAEAITSLADAFTRFKMPRSGFRQYQNFFFTDEGRYWTSTVNVAADYFPSSLVIGSSSASVVGNFAANGYSIRCIKGLIITSTTGKIWMDRNLGATQVATSSTDTNAYGDLYQWGRGTDGHQSRTSGTTTTISGSDTPSTSLFILTTSATNFDWRSPRNNTLWQGLSGINNPCPSGFRLPSRTEFENEINSWSATTSEAAFSSLKLSVTGFRKLSDGLLEDDNIRGRYWTITQDGNGMKAMDINVGGAGVITFDRGYGFAVRCIMH